MSAGVERVGRLVERYTAGDEQALGELLSRDHFEYAPAADEPDAVATWSRLLGQIRTAAPDLRIAIPDLTDEGHEILRGTAVVEGTWTGPLWGAPPSGQAYRFELPVRFRRRGDRYAVNLDLEAPAALAILRELGLVNAADRMHLPPPHPVVLDDIVLKVLFAGRLEDKPCSHLDDVRVTRTEKDTCDDCEPGAIWPALRMCLTCEHVGCCDTSVEKHAKSHWERTGHPLVRSIRMDEGWMWCYDDSAIFERRRLDAIEARLAAER